VDVRLIVPTRGDSRFMNSANLLAASVLVRKGVRVYVYPGMTHVKAALYDGWACLGSANFDKLSLRINRETNIATSDPLFVDRLRRELFDVDFARSRELVEPPARLGHVRFSVRGRTAVERRCARVPIPVDSWQDGKARPMSLTTRILAHLRRASCSVRCLRTGHREVRSRPPTSSAPSGSMRCA